jgi:uncharacterized membrane protein YbaN (DUF454 family)
MERVDVVPARPRWQRWLWVAAGMVSMAAGIVGIALPVMPTVPFVLLAAFCFSRGCRRCEQWLLDHPKLGPPIRNWRRDRSVPLRAKQLAIGMMAVSSTFAWWLLAWPWRWMPAAACLLVSLWLWRLPTTPVAAKERASR